MRQLLGWCAARVSKNGIHRKKPRHPPCQVSEREALSQLAGLQSSLDSAQDEALWLRRQLGEREAQAEAARGVNRQLMAKKEEVEW